MARLKLFLGLLVVGLLAIGLKLPAHATTMTFTGADLFNNPNVSFPTRVPTVIGSSLIFGPGTTTDHEALFVLPLLLAGSLSGATPETISVSINLTRLQCIGSGCDPDFGDHDPQIMLSDGSHLVGAAIEDNEGGRFKGSTMIYPVNFNTQRALSNTIFNFAGYPAVDGSFDINIDWTLQTGLTTVAAAFGSGSGSFSDSSRALDPTTAIDFVFVSENDRGEQYQINSLTVTTPVSGPIPAVIPEPSTMLLLASGLAGLAAWRRRKTV